MRTTAILAVLHCFLTIPGLAGTQPAPTAALAPITFVVGDPDRRFDSESAKGACLAVHVLPVIGTAESISLIQEYIGNAPTVAGVRHIFASAEPSESFQAALIALHAGEKLPVYRDSDDHLASQLLIARPVTAPVVVVLDGSGRELFRHTGRSAAEHLTFSAFAKRIAEVTQDKQSREANLTDHVALAGYDPVAYLDQGTAVPGDKKIESSFRGVSYRFASSANRDTFNTVPAKYLPAYGGWCATAMAKGDKVEIDPKNFKVTNGRLFLFYKGLFGNALNDWAKDEPGLTAKADGNWKKLVAEN